MYYFPGGMREISTFLNDIIFGTVRCSLLYPTRRSNPCTHTLIPPRLCYNCLWQIIFISIQMLHLILMLLLILRHYFQNLLACLGSSLPGSRADGLPKGFHSQVSPSKGAVHKWHHQFWGVSQPPLFIICHFLAMSVTINYSFFWYLKPNIQGVFFIGTPLSEKGV